MPKLARSGDIFRLDAEGDFDGIWLSSGKLRGSAGISFDGGVELCHGLDATVGIEASVDLEGALTVFLPSVRAEGKAFAAAGAGVQAQLAPNVFEKVGLSIDAHAFAQASVAGRIGLALDFTEIAQLAEAQLSSLAYDLFITFLNEISLEAGVWGRASLAAMAELHFEVNGTLLGDDAGFQIAMGGGAGWGGGTAWDFYAKAPIEDPRRLYTNLAELLIAELAHQARELVDPQYRPAIEVFEFVAPIAAVTAFDLGVMASEEILRPANQSVAPFLQAFSQRVALYTLDKVVELGSELLAGALMDALSYVLQQPISDSDKLALRDHIDVAIDILGDGPLELDSAVEVLTPVTDILTILAPELIEAWDDDIAMLWSAAVMARALRRSAASAGATLNVLGLGGGVSGTVLEIPPAPVAVQRAYSLHLGTAHASPGFDDVVDFLTGQSLAPLLERYVPIVDITLGRLARVLGITLGDLVEAALTAAVGENVADTDLYEQLRDYAKGAIDDVVLNELIPEMRAKLVDTPDAIAYIDEVVVPVLEGASNFAFAGVDRLVAGISAGDFDPFSASFKTGLADLVWLLLSRNVVFLTDTLTDTVVDHLHTGFADLERAVRTGQGAAMVEGAVTLGEAAFPGFNPVDPAHAEAVRELVADLLGAGSTAFGPAIWNHVRRQHLRELTQQLLDRGAVGDYASHPEVDTALKQLAECSYVSDVINLARLLEELFELTAEEFEVIIERVIPALEIFFLRLTVDALKQVEERVVNFIADVAARLRELIAELGRIAERLVQLAADIAALGAAVAAALSAIADELATQQWRDTILNAVLATGQDVAEADARALPGFSALPAARQTEAVALARGSFSIAFGLIRSALDLGLQLSGGALSIVAEAVDTSTSTPLAIAEMIGGLVGTLKTQIEDAGITLPSETAINDVEAAIVGALDTSGMRALMEAYITERRSELDATAERDELEDDQARASSKLADERKLQAGLVGSEPAVEILSPAPANPQHGFVYPRIVPVHVVVSGARASYLEPGTPPRTMVRLNGSEVGLAESAWTAADDVLTLTGLIESGLQPGLNVLEVSVADGVAEPVRAAVSFLANPALEPRGHGFRVAPELSQIDAPGNDHEALLEEWIAFQNVGSEALELAGLRVADLVGHTYTFEPRTLHPGALLRLRTGQASDTAADVHWNRKAAVWNNRGDTAYVYDADRVLWTEHRFEASP